MCPFPSWIAWHFQIQSSHLMSLWLLRTSSRPQFWTFPNTHISPSPSTPEEITMWEEESQTEEQFKVKVWTLYLAPSPYPVSQGASFTQKSCPYRVRTNSRRDSEAAAQSRHEDGKKSYINKQKKEIFDERYIEKHIWPGKIYWCWTMRLYSITPPSSKMQYKQAQMLTAYL